MKRAKIAGCLAAVLLLLTLSPMAYAEETENETVEETAEETVEETRGASSRETSGTCGDNLSWELSGTTLTISGAGEMAEGAPWQAHRERVKTLVLTGGVTTVAAGAFEGFEGLTEVNFGDSLKEIHDGAFRDCTSLKEIYLPASFRLFGPECFRGCTDLESVYCAGGMPSFRSSCLWTGNQISVFYPTNNPWPSDQVQILMGNFGGMLGVYPGSEDMAQSVAAAQTLPPETEPKETQPVETQPPTVPTTAPTQPAETTPPATEPATQATEGDGYLTTEPEQEQTEETVTYTLPTMATQPQEEPSDEAGLSGGIIAIVLIAGVLTFFLVGALIARSVSRRRYRE